MRALLLGAGIGGGGVSSKADPGWAARPRGAHGPREAEDVLVLRHRQRRPDSRRGNPFPSVKILVSDTHLFTIHLWLIVLVSRNS